MKQRIQFPGATPYKDRHGKRRWRYRKGGFSAELGTAYGSDEFVERYQAACDGYKTRGLSGAGKSIPGSLAALIASYYRSPSFLGLSDNTKRTYRGIIEPLRLKHGAKKVSHLQRRHVIALISEKAETPSAANNFKKRLRQLMDHAIDLQWLNDNPVSNIKSYRISSQGFHTWDEGEIEQFLNVHKFGSLAHQAVTLMLYTGAARVDAVALGLGNIKNGRIEYRRQKTKTRNGSLVSIPIHAKLAEVINECPPNTFTFLETTHGKSRSPNGLGNLMRRWCSEAGLPHCSAHGLRKACARRLAEAGATANEIASVTGHKTLSEVQRYTDQADRADMADSAMGKLTTGTNRDETLTNFPTRFAKLMNNSLKGKKK